MSKNIKARSPQLQLGSAFLMFDIIPALYTHNCYSALPNHLDHVLQRQVLNIAEIFIVH
jgi:hypothetical protein